MSKKKTQRRHVSLLTIRKNKTKKEQKEKFIKKKRPKGKTKISVQQSRNVRLATIVSPIDRRNDRTCSKKKKKENFSPRPFPAPRFFPRRFTFISAFLAFRLAHPFPSLLPRSRPLPTFSSSTLSPQLLLTQLGLSPLPETKR